MIINPYAFATAGGSGANNVAALRLMGFGKYKLSPTWKAVTGASEAAPGILTKIATTGWGNAGAVSVEGFTRDCRLVYTWKAPQESNKMIGLSTEATCVSYDTIDYGINLQAGGLIGLYQNSTVLGGDLTVMNPAGAAFGTLEIVRIGRTVTTYRTSSRNEEGKGYPTSFTVLPAVGAVLYVHVAMYGNGVVFDNRDMLWHEL